MGRPLRRSGRGPFVLEKRYVDVLMPDGGVVLVYLGWMRILGVRLARVTAELFEADGTVRAGSARVGTIACAEGRLLFGPARIDAGRLTWTTRGLSGDLVFRSRHAALEPRSPLLEEDGRRLEWAIEVPDADVEGTLGWPGGGRAIAGRGYRDRVFFDLLPWRFPVRDLEWGRAAAGDHATVWLSAETGSGRLAMRWEDGRLEDATAAPQLQEQRTLVRTAVADIGGLHLGLLRPLLRRLTGDPTEVKWAAAARLRGAAGRAIHERVVWH